MERKQLKFKRKTNFFDLLKKKYQEFLKSSFELIKNDNLSEKDDVKLIRSYYEDLVDENIEKNETLLKCLEDLKSLIKSHEDKMMTEKFIQVVSLLYDAKIIYLNDYIDLIDFKDSKNTSKLEADISLPETTRIVNIIENKEKNAQVMLLDDNLFGRELTLENFAIHTDKKVCQEIFNCIKSHLDTSVTLFAKKEALKFVTDLVKKVDFKAFDPNNQVELKFYGSIVNKYFLKSSDIDISLETLNHCDERALLRFLYNNIRERLNGIVYKPLILLGDQIRVPIIDLIFKSWDTIISFSANNRLGVINSKLLELYSNLDSRCMLLGLLVKIWSKINNINSAKRQYLTSYAYNLLMINFLQTRDPPILPSLQKIRENDKSIRSRYLDISTKDKDGDETKFRTRIDFEDDITILRKLMFESYSSNKKSCMELLKEFFKFYCKKENFQNKIISIKEGRLLQRKFSMSGLNYLYSIEDPFDVVNNPGRHVLTDSPHAKEIIETMAKSYKLLKHGNFTEIFKVPEKKQ